MVDDGRVQAFRQHASEKGDRQGGGAAGQAAKLIHQAADSLASQTGLAVHSAAQLRGLVPQLAATSH